MFDFLNKQITIKKALMLMTAGKIIFDTVFVESKEIKYNEENVAKVKAPFIFLRTKLESILGVDADVNDEIVLEETNEDNNIFASKDDGINKLD